MRRVLDALLVRARALRADKGVEKKAIVAGMDEAAIEAQLKALVRSSRLRLRMLAWGYHAGLPLALTLSPCVSDRWSNSLAA
eukprot:COSAG02_NODE_531_length_20680_cov_851.251834_10_plen_82_part_00